MHVLNINNLNTGTAKVVIIALVFLIYSRVTGPQICIAMST